jgi:hypothetical protein
LLPEFTLICAGELHQVLVELPVPAFAVTVPGTGCLTAEPSTLTAVAFAPVFASETSSGAAATPSAVPVIRVKYCSRSRSTIIPFFQK